MTLILPFFGTRPKCFSVLVQTVFWYSHGFYFFPILARILRFSGTDTYSTIFRYSSGTRPNSTLLWYWLGFYLSRYSPGPFFSTRPDSTFLRYSPRFYLLRYSPGFYPSSEHARILPFSGTCPDSTFLRYWFVWFTKLVMKITSVLKRSYHCKVAPSPVTAPFDSCPIGVPIDSTQLMCFDLNPQTGVINKIYKPISPYTGVAFS